MERVESVKRLFAGILVFALAVSLFGCTQSQEEPPKTLTGAFSFNAGILLGGKNYSAQVQKQADGVWTMKFTDPPSLKGMEVRYQNGEAAVTYLGIEWEVPSDLLPSTAVPEGMLGSLEDLENGKVTASEEDGRLVYSGESESGRYKIYVDKETGEPVYAKLPSLGLEFSMEDFSRAG